MSQIKEVVNSRRKEALEELFELLRIPSVSTDDAKRPDIARCAELVASRMKSANVTARPTRRSSRPCAINTANPANQEPPAPTRSPVR